MIDINKFLLFEKEEVMDDENIIITKHFLTCEINIVDLMSSENKKIITIKLSLINESYLDDEIITKGCKSTSFGLDIELDDPEMIYSVANMISCGLLNSFSHLFKIPEKVYSGSGVKKDTFELINMNDFQKL